MFERIINAPANLNVSILSVFHKLYKSSRQQPIDIAVVSLLLPLSLSLPLLIGVVCSGPFRTSKIERFAKIVNR